MLFEQFFQLNKLLLQIQVIEIISSSLLRLHETCNVLQLPVFFFSYSFSCQPYSEYQGIWSKQLFCRLSNKLIQYMGLEIQFRSLKYTVVNKPCNGFANGRIFLTQSENYEIYSFQQIFEAHEDAFEIKLIVKNPQN